MDLFREILNTQIDEVREPDADEDFILSLDLNEYHNELDSFHEEIKKSKKRFELRYTLPKENVIELEKKLLKIQKKRAKELVKENDFNSWTCLIEFQPIIDIVYEYEDLINQTRELLKEIEARKEHEAMLIKKRKDVKKIIFYSLPYFFLLFSFVNNLYHREPFFYNSFAGFLEFLFWLIIIILGSVLAYGILFVSAFLLNGILLVFLSEVLRLLEGELISLLKKNPDIIIKKSDKPIKLITNISLISLEDFSVIYCMIFVLFKMIKLENPPIIFISLILIFASYYFLIRHESK